MMNKISNELFEKKYGKTLIKWLKLVKNQRAHFSWRPDNHRDLYGMKLYEISCEHNNALREFEKTVDKNILNSYLKYHNYNEEQIKYPFSFNYSEPSIDLVTNPIK